MKGYRGIASQLGLTGICFGNCGLGANRHRGSIFLGIVHWSDRRVTKRGLRRLLLLVAKRDRFASPGFLNDPGLWWAHMYLDQRRADRWAEQLGVRFPASYSAPERRAVSLVPGLSRRHPAVWMWARRGARV